MIKWGMITLLYSKSHTNSTSHTLNYGWMNGWMNVTEPHNSYHSLSSPFFFLFSFLSFFLFSFLFECLFYPLYLFRSLSCFLKSIHQIKLSVSRRFIRNPPISLSIHICFNSHPHSSTRSYVDFQEKNFIISWYFKTSLKEMNELSFFFILFQSIAVAPVYIFI